MSELRFDGRVAVITGAGRGLGRAYAELLGARGAKVVVNDTGGTPYGEGTDNGPAEEVVRNIKASGSDAVICAETVATPEGGQAIIDTAIKNFGRVDILIHNAGIRSYGLLKEISYDAFKKGLDVHLFGAFNVLRPSMADMAKRKYGRVVLTSSVASYGLPNHASYSVGKSAMIGLMNTAALEGAADGIKCNSILPGAITRLASGRDTSAYPPMTAEMVAPVVAYLCHESCQMNGELVISMANRVARAKIVESPGFYKPTWTPEDVAKNLDKINDLNDGFYVTSDMEAHIRYSFEFARAHGAK
jgi:NAD(P)-dependent dehydrogenase (short-subunit alcohol dehydrogenase family)